MKANLYFLLLLAVSGAFCTPQKTAQVAVTTPVEDSVLPEDIYLLKNINDSASYAIGVSVANYYKQMGVKEINTNLVSKAIKDILAGDTALINDNECNTLMNNYLTLLMAEKSKGAIEEGEKFLAQNKLRPEVTTTASGLQYEVLKEGTGIKPTVTDSVTCHYRGYFMDGTDFDNSYKRGEPITFSLGGVIRGWTEGLQLMSVGAKYRFYVPYQLGYGPSDYMSIPGGSMLTFEVELLDVKKN